MFLFYVVIELFQLESYIINVSNFIYIAGGVLSDRREIFPSFDFN